MPAARLRVVPGRVALFFAVLALVATVLVPRLAAAASGAQQDPSVHVVTAGETLWQVAVDNSGGGDVRGYVDALRRVNRLSSAVIRPGQELVLP